LITATIKGPDLVAAITAANIRIEANAEIALDMVAAATQSDAQAACPVQTGALRADIKIYEAKLLRQIGNNLYYAPFVHNGTIKMRPRPYLTGAFFVNTPSLINNIQALGA
jgi:hypothetical protein